MSSSADMSDTTPGFLSKERIIAGDGYNRWLVPPAALAIHLCIGMAYGFSVFWLPLSKALGIKEPIKCAADIGFFQELFTSTCDWKVSTLGWMYTLFFVLLGRVSKSGIYTCRNLETETTHIAMLAVAPTQTAWGPMANALPAPHQVNQ